MLSFQRVCFAPMLKNYSLKAIRFIFVQNRMFDTALWVNPSRSMTDFIG